MAKFDPLKNRNPQADCQKNIVMGDQVGEEAWYLMVSFVIFSC